MSSAADYSPIGPRLVLNPACRARSSIRRRDRDAIHEIKHDDFRILAHRQGRSIRWITRNGHDLADRFPLAAAATEVLPVRSCVVDAEAIVCDGDGLAVFDLIRGHGRTARAVLCAFDLLEVNGEDIRQEPIEDRMRRLAGLLRLPHEGIARSTSILAAKARRTTRRACEA